MCLVIELGDMCRNVLSDTSGFMGEWTRAMFFRGVSTRKVGNILNCLCGEGVSANYVSEVTKALDKEVKAFERRPIEDDFAFLFLDGLDIKFRRELSVKRYKTLIAYGIRRDGSRSFISFRLAPHEGSGTWRSFLDNLKVRGMARLRRGVDHNGWSSWFVISYGGGLCFGSPSALLGAQASQHSQILSQEV